ncbi:MAG TPA: metallophosphoesterase [Acidimicrobiales bacterium]|nr:metallophosphoesterase [Acidimicrobiales bacterium]
MVISDLHLGANGAPDVLRRDRERAALVARLPEFDRLVLLGDTVELRHGPVRDALATAAPVLAELAGALGAGGEAVLVPGNHDHALLRGWLERRDPSLPLGLESTVDQDPREPLGALVAALAPARVRVAYPGVWLRDDVYATHGHYGDRHNTVPILERLGAGVTVRVAGEPSGGPVCAEDYEAALAPMYAWADAVAQSGGLHVGGGGSFQIAAWQRLNGSSGVRRSLRTRAMALGLTAAVAALNRAGMGPLRPDVSGVALRRGALAGFTEVLARLAVPAAVHVIFGHTHRAGPLPGDDRSEWGRLLNTGSWVYEPRFVGGDPLGSPYRPGFAAVVGEDGPPELVNLLDPA